MSDKQMEVYKILQSSQDKYVYFEMAATMTAIGFAITQTKTLKLSTTQVLLGVSVFFWGLSFLCGLLNRTYYNSYLGINYNILKIEHGEHPDITCDHDISDVTEGLRKRMNKKSAKGSGLANLQTLLLCLGAISYIGWHIYEMYLRI